MPLFGQKGSRNKNKSRNPKPFVGKKESQTVAKSPEVTQMSSAVTEPKLTFHCQEAQGGVTGLISGFTSVRELYSQIGSCFGFPAEQILFCTLNTHRVDMDHLLSSQLSLDDFIFVHRKGNRKEVQVRKNGEALGLTITDNGVGVAFIKRIKKGSTVDVTEGIDIGDHIESIDGVTLTGRRHAEVAKNLKDIPVGSSFTLTLIEPIKSGFGHIWGKGEVKKRSVTSLTSGTETLRLRTNGPARIERGADQETLIGVTKVNDLLETFLGISDHDLASQIWELGEGKKNTMELAEAIHGSDLDSFGFTHDFIIEVWGIVTDGRAGRFKGQQVNEKENGGEEDLAHLISKWNLH